MAQIEQSHDPYPIRPISEEEFDSFQLVLQHAFHGSPPNQELRQRTLALQELDRSLAAVDPDLGRPVGITSVRSFQLTVPGSSVPAAGVTWVAVLPTHRRRGVLNSLMRRQLADITAAGREPIAALWATEAGIYGRYGYGAASWHMSFEARRGEGALSPGGARVLDGSGVRLRLVTPAEARAELAKVYDTALPSRPGFFARNDQWWERRLFDPEDGRKGASPLRCLLAEDDSGPRGYALYAGLNRPDDANFLPQSGITVRELIAVDAAASAALWSNLLSRDLTVEVRANNRPVDDPLLSLLADPRRLRPQVADGLWVRLVDLPRALSTRRYSAPADVVIEVRDRGLPVNDGRWRLVTQGGPVRQLSAAMSWDPAPWCPMIF